MKEKVIISYGKGITHSPSDILCNDGDLEECVNLEVKNGELSPTEMPSVLGLELEEGERIIELIRKYKAQGIPYKEMAVLFRTNTQARSVMGKLLSYNIPFQMRDVVPNLFDHWIAKNIITYIIHTTAVQK